jgi:hypothetical protein
MGVKTQSLAFWIKFLRKRNSTHGAGVHPRPPLLLVKLKLDTPQKQNKTVDSIKGMVYYKW